MWPARTLGRFQSLCLDSRQWEICNVKCMASSLCRYGNTKVDQTNFFEIFVQCVVDG